LGAKRPAIDLLQGFAEPISSGSATGSWWPAVAIVLLTITLYMGTSGYQYYLVQKEVRAITQQSEELFRKTFPGVKRLVRPLVQAQQKLEQRRISHGQINDDLLTLLSILGKAKQKIGPVEFKNLEYRQKSLVIYLAGESVAQIEKLKQWLDSGGAASSEILSTVAKGKKVEARIKIKVKSA